MAGRGSVGLHRRQRWAAVRDLRRRIQRDGRGRHGGASAIIVWLKCRRGGERGLDGLANRIG